MCLVVCIANALACDLPTDVLDTDQLIPKSVQARYCNPGEGHASFLLIRAAVIVDKPVFRIITVKKDGADRVQGVRLYQFDKYGNNHPDVAGEPQAVIDFKGQYPAFKARVKGKRTMISFLESKFEFKMRGLFGLTIKQHLNAKGRISIAGSPTSVLIIRTANEDHWQWVLDDGKPVHFRKPS